jgi:hypothetical protein
MRNNLGYSDMHVCPFPRYATKITFIYNINKTILSYTLYLAITIDISRQFIILRNTKASSNIQQWKLLKSILQIPVKTGLTRDG